MTKVFIGGSRRLTRLSQAVVQKLDAIVAKGYTILVGDANGIDRAVQQYMAGKGYQDLLVYCVNDTCRNNIGHWKTVSVTKDSLNKDFDYYVTKDREMAREATCAFMMWDGKSKGTLRNVLDLLKDGKTVLVYLSLNRQFYTLQEPRDLPALTGECDPKIVERLAQHLNMATVTKLGQRDLDFR